ncbi:hypothetical protein PVAND_015373 [Polypedilum vanderplanki]|uniref:Serine protease n=1 Tax=Polypedilum vanderplanki TaxID=319348 RepID=A0A9J6BCU5_POLVA|nr:hypothetical protein PVAND_015373 [Polypedilum vanderplanki]
MQFCLIFFTIIIFNLLQIKCVNVCGVQNIDIRFHSYNLIVQGYESVPGEWPWHVALYNYHGYNCGASLISEWNLLSAAHCFGESSEQLQLDDFYAILGRFDLRDTTETHWIKRQFSSITIHEDFKMNVRTKKSNGDIAVIKMSQKVEFTDRIRPICLPNSNSNVDGLLGTVVGYGNSGSNRLHEFTPQKGQIRTISYSRCLSKDPFYKIIVSERSFCGGETTIAPCHGDSGGGFFVKNSQTNQFTLYGIVSQGAKSKECSPNDYVVFVDVSKFINWILNAITTSGNIISRGKCLSANQQITSNNGCFVFIFQTDGNAVVYSITSATSKVPIWATGTHSKNPNADRICLQSNGDLVAYSGTKAYFASNTAGTSGRNVVMQDDGNLVMYGENNKVIWATNTVQQTLTCPFLSTTKTSGCANGGKLPYCCANGSTSPYCCENNSPSPHCCANGSMSPHCCANGSMNRDCS